MKFLNSTVDINFIILYKNLGNFLLNAFKTYALTNLSTIFCNFSGFSNILKNKLNVIQIIHSGIRIRPVPGIFKDPWSIPFCTSRLRNLLILDFSCSITNQFIIQYWYINFIDIYVKGKSFFWLGLIRIRDVFRGSDSDLVFLKGRIRILFFSWRSDPDPLFLCVGQI